MSCLSNTNEVASLLHAYVYQACIRAFKLRKCGTKVNKTKGAPWFDAELRQLRSEAIKAGERVNSVEDRQRLVCASRKYRAKNKRKHGSIGIK